MSKERLEEIRERMYREGYLVIVGGAEIDGLLELEKDMEWLIEQAERVQELERVNKQLKNNPNVYKGYYKNMIKINEDTVEENKRYREALEAFEKNNCPNCNDKRPRKSSRARYCHICDGARFIYIKHGRLC